MAQYFSDIAKDVKSGEYFRFARGWYIHRFVYPGIEASYLIVLILASLFLLWVCFKVMVATYPLTIRVPLVAEITQPEEEYARLMPLQNTGDKQAHPQYLPNIALLEYLLIEYVQAQEIYDHEENLLRMEKNMNVIEQFSVPSVFAAFQESLRYSNPKSPILRYREHTKRDITVQAANIQLSPSILEEIKHPPKGALLQGTAYVPFVATQTSQDTQIASHWTAKIDFLFTPIAYNYDQKAFEPLSFRVKAYQASEVKN